MSKEVLAVIKPEDSNASVHKEPELSWWGYKWNGGEMSDPINWYIATIEGQYLPAEIEDDPLVEEAHPQLVVDK